VSHDREVKNRLALTYVYGEFPVPLYVRAEEVLMHFEDSELIKLGVAYDRAWDRFVRTGMLTPDNLSKSREILAKRIVQCAATGERDEWRLARHALFSLWQLQFAGTPPLPVVRRRARGGQNPRGHVGAS
jgi:hypothetical protein